MLPKHIQSPEAAFALMVAGRELGLLAMQSIRSFHLIEGKIAMPAELILARVKRSPECLYFRLVESTATRAEYVTQRKGEPHPTAMAFTIEEAHAAGLTGKDNWRKYGPAMLRARCVSALCRAVYPESVLGIYDPDELEREHAPATISNHVEVVSRRPNEAARTLPVDGPSPVEAETIDVAAELAERIVSAETTDELAEVGKAIATAAAEKKLTQRQVFDLKAGYRASQAAFKKAAKAPAPPVDGLAEQSEHAGRQPGED